MNPTSTKAAAESRLKSFVIVLMTFYLQGICCSLGLAEAASPITSSGLNTQVTLSAKPPAGKTQYDITGGTRPGGGTNLFHSFGNFNVPNNNIANFLNSGSVDLNGALLPPNLLTSNILGRVNGGNPSVIFGMIQTTNFGNANLFLMNPAGYLFGPNATLNVGGMVAFTSADYLRHADGAVFNAIPNPATDALLSAAPIAAFGFLGSNPGAITVQGSQLSVTPAQSISLVGGNITINSGVLDDGVTVQPARLSAPNGQINLATAASPGAFLLQGLATGGGPSASTTLLAGPNVNNASFASFGAVHLAPGSVLDTSQPGNSKVSIIGGQFVVDVQNALLSSTSTAPAAVGQNNVLLTSGSSIITRTSSELHGPDIQIVADTIQLLGSFAPPFIVTPVNIRAETRGSGSAGNISLTANQNLELSVGRIASSTFNSTVNTGTGGHVDLTSTQGNISLKNQTLVTSQGHPGDLTLNAPHGDILLDMSQVNTQVLTAGVLGVNGGGIQVTAKNLTMSNSQNLVPSSIDGANFANPQVPGNITVTLSGSLSMSGGSAITTVSRGPAAGAADLNITAHDVSLTGTGLNPPNPQVFNTRLVTQTINSGTGGQLNIVADNIQLTNGGQLQSGSVIGRDPSTGQPTNPSGPGGTINIHGPSGPTASVLIDGAGSGIFTNSQGSGSGGNTNIAAQSVTIQNGGLISAQANGSGPGGQVKILADSLQLINGGQLTSGSVIGTNPVTNQLLPPPSGTAGGITIRGLDGPAGSVLIDGAKSGIFTNAAGTGAAGNTNLSAQSLTIQNGGTISAATSGTVPGATGGSININTTDGVRMTNGTITASSTGPGNAGNISINAGQQLQMQNSSIKTEAAQAGGGNINIQAVQLLRAGNSEISTSVLGGGGSGGNITIDPNAVILQNSQILAQAVQGAGGNISITTNLLLADINSTISASSQFGRNGTVTIQSPISPASGKIIPLSQRPLIATSLLSQRCAALAGGNFSSFTVAGRDSLPAEPGAWLSSPLALTITESGSGTLTESGTTLSRGELAGETPLLSLRQIAPPGFLTQTFAVDSLAGCAS